MIMFAFGALGLFCLFTGAIGPGIAFLVLAAIFSGD